MCPPETMLSRRPICLLEGFVPREVFLLQVAPASETNKPRSPSLFSPGREENFSEEKFLSGEETSLRLGGRGRRFAVASIDHFVQKWPKWSKTQKPPKVGKNP